MACWKETREWSLEGFRQIYGMLDIPFDIYYFPVRWKKPVRLRLKN